MPRLVVGWGGGGGGGGCGFSTLLYKGKGTITSFGEGSGEVR